MQYKNVSLLVALLMALMLCYLHAIIAPVVGEEMRYASVAWRMFQEHNWFIPQLGNNAYLHKTPLLFWLLDMGWWVNIHWPWQIIIPAVLASLTILYTQKLAQAIFPGKSYTISVVPLVLIATPFFINNLGILRFDMMLTLFNVMACYFLTKALSSRKYYGLFIVMNGLGLLAKGPVIYIFTIPEALLFCFYFSNRFWQDAIKLLMGILISLSALVIWWGPIIYQGQAILLREMFLEQVVARTTGSAGVVKPMWDYIPLLPCFFLPWMFFVPCWRAKFYLGESEKNKKIVRYLVCVFITCFIIFSLIKTKESRYLLPVIPLTSIAIAYRLEKMILIFSSKRYFVSTLFMGAMLCLSAFSLLLVLHYAPQKVHIFYAPYFSDTVAYVLFCMGLIMMVGARYSINAQVKLLLFASICVSGSIDLGATYAISKTQDVQPAVQFISQLLFRNIPVVSETGIVLDMQFAGRWPHGVPVISPGEVATWAKQHPDAWIVTHTEKKNLTQAYAKMVENCFEQTYSHMRAVLSICPISVMVADDAK